ncbi:MAG: TMEM43 family protein [Chitinophagales bacterium]
MSTRYRTESYGSKLGNSFKGIIGGFFAILLSIGLLWWNESNSVKEIRKISEGKKNTISISADQVLSENEGKLVHLSGEALTDDIIRDEEFGFEVNAIQLIKTVEMYQYKENKKTEKKDNLGGSTTYIDTYTYEEVWSSSLINSDGFDESWRENPKDFEHNSENYLASNVNLGAFRLSSELIAGISGAESYPISEAMYSDSSGNSTLSGGMIYFGSGSKNPSIGDERISYKVIYPKQISIIAQQAGSSFVSYISSNGRSISLVSSGLVSADEMYAAEAQKNKILSWVLRFLGFIIMFAGFAAILKPISTLGSVIPLLGNVLEVGTGLIAGLLAFVISFVVIALAWIFYRPILGISLLLLAGGAFFYGKKIFSKKGDLPEVKKMDENA